MPSMSVPWTPLKLAKVRIQFGLSMSSSSEPRRPYKLVKVSRPFGKWL